MTIGAADPLNLSGILVPGSRIPVTSSENLILGEGGLRPAGQSPIRPEFETPDAGREAGRAGAPT